MRDRFGPERATCRRRLRRPPAVENYRAGHRLALASRDGNGSTEDLRQAMRHYRALFEELAESPVDQPLSRDDAGTTATGNEEAIR